jgi:hypothetical protein
MQICGIREDGVDNSLGRFHRVFPNEQHGISMHGISQKTLIGRMTIETPTLEPGRIRTDRRFTSPELRSGGQFTENKLHLQKPQDVEG